jgi:hypothetical protein
MKIFEININKKLDKIIEDVLDNKENKKVLQRNLYYDSDKLSSKEEKSKNNRANKVNVKENFNSI